MDVLGRMKKNCRRLRNDLALGHDLSFWNIHAGYMSCIRKLKFLFSLYVKGRILDAGAGTCAYKKLLEKYGEYYALDINKNHKHLDCIGTITNIPAKDAVFDTVVCLQTLQYVSDIRVAAKELKRVLKRGGHLIITVPHLSYLNNEPYDFWRFTKYSLKYLFEEKNFEITDIQESGGIFAFCGWVFSTILLGLTYKIVIVWQISYLINRVVQSIFLMLDKITRNYRVMPFTYIMVVQRKK